MRKYKDFFHILKNITCHSFMKGKYLNIHISCPFYLSLPEAEEKDPFGIIVSYSIKVKLILGALGG